VNRFTLEIITERKVAQHLKESVVIRRHAHVADVARSQAFLARRRLREIQRTDSQKLILELIHARRSEQDRGIVLWYEHVTGATHAAFGFKERQIFFTQFVGFHGACRGGLQGQGSEIANGQLC